MEFNHPLVNVLSGINEEAEDIKYLGEENPQPKSAGIHPAVWLTGLGLIAYALINRGPKKEISEENKEKILSYHERLVPVEEIAELVGLDPKDVQGIIDTKRELKLELHGRKRAVFHPSFQVEANPSNLKTFLPYEIGPVVPKEDNRNFFGPDGSKTWVGDKGHIGWLKENEPELYDSLYAKYSAKIEKDGAKADAFIDDYIMDDFISQSGNIRQTDYFFVLPKLGKTITQLQTIKKFIEKYPKIAPVHLSEISFDNKGYPYHDFFYIERYHFLDAMTWAHVNKERVRDISMIGNPREARIENGESRIEGSEQETVNSEQNPEKNPKEDENENVSDNSRSPADGVFSNEEKDLKPKRRGRSKNASKRPYKRTRKASRSLKRGKDGKFKKGA